MMEVDQSESVYSMITTLCEHFVYQYSEDPLKVRYARSMCFEALLKKILQPNPSKFKDSTDMADPISNALAWSFQLSYDFGLRDHALDINNTIDTLSEEYKENPDSFKRILKFLLCLRDIPSENPNKLDLSTLPPIENHLDNYMHLFKFPASLRCEPDTYSETTFNLNYYSKIDYNLRIQENIAHEDNDCMKMELMEDDSTFVLTRQTKDEILKIASETPYCSRRNWENYGYYEPVKEKPFLSELGDLSSLWVENLKSLYIKKGTNELTGFHNKEMIPRKVFLNDVKFMLIGIPTKTFELNTNQEFSLSSRIMVQGITPSTFRSYCENLVFSGNCYKALVIMSTRNPYTRRYKYPGYVYTEFCESLSKYLQYYRACVMKITDSTTFLFFLETTHQLRMQISTLASICKVGPFENDCEEMPHGVALLNYLYQKVIQIPHRYVQLVLYSILYPCCQVYYSRFLQKWILEGTLNDPYNEFFIVPKLKYISTRGRTYWTRSYQIQEDIIPDFLVEIKDCILSCGKMMNLLKLCNRSSDFLHYLIRNESPLISCCATKDQLTVLEQNTKRYYLDAFSESGGKFSVNNLLDRSHENDLNFLSLIAKKRSETLKRIELEKMKRLEEQKEKKLEEMASLKEQLETMMEEKQLRTYKEIEKEIRVLQENVEIERMRENLIHKESQDMIEYYTKLCNQAEIRKKQIHQYFRTVKNIQLDLHSEKERPTIIDPVHNSSSESFYSAPDHQINDVLSDISDSLHTSQSLDIINANTDPIKEEDEDMAKSDDLEVCQDMLTQDQFIMNENIKQAIENFEMARRNKQKVLKDDIGITFEDTVQNNTIVNKNIVNLTAAQKNKLKVMSSEFGIEYITSDNAKQPAKSTESKILNIVEINRNRVLNANDCFKYSYDNTKLDNEQFFTGNAINNTVNVIKKSLSLNLTNNVYIDPQKPIPMSVDSTPMSEFLPPSTLITPSTSMLSLDTKLDSLPNTADTNQTESAGFNFVMPSTSSSTIHLIYDSQTNRDPTVQSNRRSFSKNVTKDEAEEVTKNGLHYLESVAIPLHAQLQLANNEILKYFFVDLKYLTHLNSLKDYFFLQDGEFGRNMTENLFHKLYGAKFPLDLINCRTLQNLVFDALDNSNNFQENSQLLSFKINSLPKCFDLGNPDVLSCISLTYNVNWPLNILLPSETIAKYGTVFKYLLKLNRVEWVLKKIFLELKLLAKETGRKEIYLMACPQYKRVHQCRHVMTHFINTLKGYIIGNVLQKSWVNFEEALRSVQNLDDIYSAHTIYVKNILFMCILTQKSAAMSNVLQKIFEVILKFYDYLRSRNWVCEEGNYTHPNFEKLDKIFENFHELALYFCKTGRKVVKCRYQPDLMQFLDTLNVNEYYY